MEGVGLMINGINTQLVKQRELTNVWDNVRMAPEQIYILI
jgi:hypothetical protein